MLTAKLSTLAEGIVMATPSPRIRVLFDNHNRPEQKAIAYLGFEDEVSAHCFRDWLLEKGMKPYSRTHDAGICKPRKAERVDGMAYELKWHRPDPALLNKLIAKDLSRCNVAVAV